MKVNDIEWILGNENIKVCPLQPYSDIVIEFLDDLSKDLRKKAISESMTDVMSLAFWCRKSNVHKMKSRASDYNTSIGRGLVFHITPSNVPVNFAFSYFFGLLSGNANIVRVPTKDWKQIDVIIATIQENLNKQKYQPIKESTAFVKYSHNKLINDKFSAIADVRIIWGGDEAIKSIRMSTLKSKGIEVVFADRYSVGFLDSESILNATDDELGKLAENFYNDTYLMDQNACSTPHLILWTGNNSSKAKVRFWNNVAKKSEKYGLEPIKSVDKYTDLCIASMSEDIDITDVKMYTNLLYTIELNSLPEDISILRGRFGMFYQYDITNCEELAPYVTERLQTVLYYGVCKEQFADMIYNNKLRGIDRVVPFGNSLDMNEYWDGYDIIGQLSRRIKIV